MNFKSNLEATVAQLHPQLVYEPTKFNYTLNYIPDFLLITRRGKAIYIEVKGAMTGTMRSKMLAVKRDNPDKEIRFLFQAPNNRLHKRSSTTYGDWATKHGFIWAEAPHIPESWQNE